MSKEKDTGGPAYPTVEYIKPEGPGMRLMTIKGGMSLRDRYAMAAMQGDWAAQNEACGAFKLEVETARLHARARLYYRMADAMLEVRGEA